MHLCSRRIALVSSLLLLAGAGSTQAAARVFVSVNGNDMNTCSDVNTPCRTFSAAITQVDAGGEVIVLNTGSYGGASVGKSVRINVPTGVVAFAATGFTINAGLSDVVALRGLTLKALTPGAGTGVQFNTGAALHIEHCVIDGWQVGVSFRNPGRLFINDTVVRNTGNEGVGVSAGAGTASASIEHTRLEGNGLAGNQCGLIVNGGGKASVRDSEASGNEFGFCSQGTGAELSVKDVLAANNVDDGVGAFGAGTIRASNVISTNNGTGFHNNGSTFESLGNNLVRGNTANTSGAITVIAGQ